MAEDEPVYGESPTQTARKAVAAFERTEAARRLTSEEAAAAIGPEMAQALGEAGLLPCSRSLRTGLIRWPCVKAAGHSGSCETKLGVYFRTR